MSETPRTDKCDIDGLVVAVLARNLERELAISSVCNANLAVGLLEAKARIAELERLLSRVRGDAVDLREPHQMDRWEKECDIHASREGGT